MFTLTWSAKAHEKMRELVDNRDTEIGWYGVCERVGDRVKVTDILVYPQRVTGSTFETDDIEMLNWFDSLPMDVVNHIRLHGHSHVNMQVYPSLTDLNFEDQILGELGLDDYYIFMITNKREEVRYRFIDKDDEREVIGR